MKLASQLYQTAVHAKATLATQAVARAVKTVKENAKEAADQGEFETVVYPSTEVHLNEAIRAKVIKQIQRCGFKVEQHPEQNAGWLTVSWDMGAEQ